MFRLSLEFMFVAGEGKELIDISGLCWKSWVVAIRQTMTSTEYVVEKITIDEKFSQESISIQRRFSYGGKKQSKNKIQL